MAHENSELDREFRAAVTGRMQTTPFDAIGQITFHVKHRPLPAGSPLGPWPSLEVAAASYAVFMARKYHDGNG